MLARNFLVKILGSGRCTVGNLGDLLHNIIKTFPTMQWKRFFRCNSSACKTTNISPEKDILRKRPHYSPYCFSCHKTKKPFTPQYSPSFNGYEGLVQYNWGVLTKRGHTEREAIKVVSRCELNIPSYCQDIEITGRVIISTVGILYIEIYSFQLKSEIQQNLSYDESIIIENNLGKF